MSRFYKVSILAPLAADINGICESQTPLTAGPLNINGALASSGIASLDKRKIRFTFAANESSRSFVITGSLNGVQLSETVSGSSTTSDSVNYYTSISSITIDNASAGSIQVGTNGEAAGDWVKIDYPEGYTGVGLQISPSIGAVLNYTVQQTMADVTELKGVVPINEILNHDDDNLISQTVSRIGNFVIPVTAVRLITNSYSSGSVKLVVVRGT